MKKTTLLLLLFTILLTGLSAQVDNKNMIDQEVNLRQIATLGPGSAGARGFDNRYEGVRGTPLLFEDWKEARIQVQGGKAEGERVKVNINQFDNLVLFKFPAGEAGSVPVSKIRMLHVETTEGLRTFEAFPTMMVEGGDDDTERLYEVLYRTPFTLLKDHEKLFMKADYKGAYSSDRRFDEFVDQQRYYLRQPNGAFEKLNKLKRKAILKALPDYKNKIDKITKEEKLDLDKEKDLIRLLEILSQ